MRSLIDLAPSIMSCLGMDYIIREMPWHGKRGFLTLDDREYVVAETAHTSYSGEPKEEFMKYSIITMDEIITYKPKDDLAIVRDRRTDRIKQVTIGEHDHRVEEYISIVKKHINMEKKSWVVERICRSMRRLRRKHKL